MYARTSILLVPRLVPLSLKGGEDEGGRRKEEGGRSEEVVERAQAIEWTNLRKSKLTYVQHLTALLPTTTSKL